MKFDPTTLKSYGAEGRDVVGFMGKLIPLLLGKDHFPAPLAIEVAHRTPGLSKTNPKAGPRPIIIKLLHFNDKMKIIRLAREKKALLYEGTRIHIYPDFSAGVLQKRRQFDSVKKRLRELNISYALLYPAVLRIHTGDKTLLCRSPEEAQAFVRDVDMHSP
ncbi:hypothetical protein WMY93_016775 [Mugilogobius chulae]|uniref:L1 transposable element RRM domain-containing protein n=1 Tax=Mugilogobius chulae TaxID=88201 RepID=A0AAW0NMG9_9GOBI